MVWRSKLAALLGQRTQSTPESDAESRSYTVKLPGGVIETRTVEDDGRTFDQWVADMEAKTPAPSSRIRVKSQTVDLESLTQCDLRQLPNVRTRIKGSAYVISDSNRAKFGGTEYLLVREPSNKADTSAVAIYGNGHKVGYLSAAKAATFAPLLDSMSEEAFVVGGTSIAEHSIKLWVDLPTLPSIRGFVASRT